MVRRPAAATARDRPPLFGIEQTGPEYVLTMRLAQLLVADVGRRWQREAACAAPMLIGELERGADIAEVR